MWLDLHVEEHLRDRLARIFVFDGTAGEQLRELGIVDVPSGLFVAGPGILTGGKQLL